MDECKAQLIVNWTIIIFIYLPRAAIKHDQIEVFGYVSWSLLDGFEWQQMFNNRRGLFYVDLNSKEKERIPKSSAFYYKQIIQENGFPAEESTQTLRGQFPRDFFWGITESVIKVSSLKVSTPTIWDG